MCSCDANCQMQLYLINNTGQAPTGGTMTLQNVVLSYYAPCVTHVIGSSAEVQTAACAYGWDNGSISYNMPNGEVLNIVYDGSDIDNANANFSAPSQTYTAAKAVYQGGILITVGIQGNAAANA
ncbi:MAG: hypothetical protein ABI644_09235 [Arenimonas sp.]